MGDEQPFRTGWPQENGVAKLTVVRESPVGPAGPVHSDSICLGILAEAAL